jgi:hypothetical protein
MSLQPAAAGLYVFKFSPYWLKMIFCPAKDMYAKQKSTTVVTIFFMSNFINRVLTFAEGYCVNA